MKVLHVNAGTEVGGGKVHLISLLSQVKNEEIELLTFQDGMIAREAQEIGIKTTVLNQKHQLDLSILLALKKYISEGNFDIIHSHGPRANLFIRLIRRFITGKWIITVHSDPRLDFINEKNRGNILSKLNISSIMKADYIIAVSSKIKHYLIEKGFNSTRIDIVHNGIIFPDKLNNKHQSNKQFTITHIGRFHPVKRHDYLIDTILKSGITDFKLNLIGNGELLPKIKNLVKELNIEQQVKFHGHLSMNEINSILDATDVSILTSESETFPLVLLESASRKVPFITTDVGDVRVLDPRCENSWIVRVSNQHELIKAVLEAYKLWENDTLYLKGERLFNDLSNKYTLKNMYENTIKVYKKTIKNY